MKSLNEVTEACDVLLEPTNVVDLVASTQSHVRLILGI
jgi:hypothetical protein